MNILQSILGKSSAAVPDPITQPLLDQITETLGADIAPMPADKEHLSLAISRARQYFESQAELIPGPVDISMASFDHDPLLNILFTGPDEIRQTMGRSLDMKYTLPKLSFGGHFYPYIYGLLAIRGKVDHQTPGQLRVFVDHTLAILSPSAEDVRGRLADAAFRRVLINFDEHTLRLRQKEKLLRSEWNIENIPPRERDGRDDYVYADRELTPENMLRGLMAWLARPQEHLRISRDKPVILDTPGNGHRPVHLELPTLHCTDRRQWLICLVKLPTQEAAQAQEQEGHPHRFLFI